MLTEEDKALLWSKGRLAWKLDPSQREAYDAFRKWEKETTAARLRGEELPGMFPRVFVLDAARRTGKDFLTLLIFVENAIRRPGSVFSYGCAFAKDISEIIVSLFEKITEDCPPNQKPVYRDAFRGQASGIYFANKSIIRLIGCDRQADSLRGRFSNGIALSECGFMDSLKDVIVSILMPQLQGDQQAVILLNSTPPVTPGHPYDDLFVPDAHDRGAVVQRTIYDNPRLTDAEKQEFIRAAGGIDSETCRREYFCERVRSATRVVIPEFDEKRHVIASPRPRYARSFTVLDPGIRDLCGVLWAYWDFDRAKLVIEKSWAQSNTNTDDLIKVIKQSEFELWNNKRPLKYWSKDHLVQNPSLRVSDVEARLVQDMKTIHGLNVIQARKDDKLAAIHAFRNAFLQDRIEVHPDAKEAISHFKNGIWNKTRTDFDRSDMYGHFDVLAAGIYLWRHVNQHDNPNPPGGWVASRTVAGDQLFVTKEHYKQPGGSFVDKLNSVFPSLYSRKR